MSLKDNLRYLRRQFRLSQQDLANRFGYKSFTTIQKWEDGTSIPPMPKLRELADFYHVSMEELIGAELVDKQIAIPIVGVVRGGPLRLAQDEFIGQEWVERTEAAGGQYFYLEVTGDSMINARIYPHDLVYVKRQAEVENGQIAVVLVGEEATLKRVYLTADGIILKPENDAYAPMTFTREEVETKPVRILGRVVHNKIRF